MASCKYRIKESLNTLNQENICAYDNSISESVMEKLFQVLIISAKLHVEQDKRYVTNIM